MKVILNSRFDVHDVEGEIHHGKMVPSFENPSRVKHIRDCLEKNGYGDFIEPCDFGIEPILRVHKPDYVSFLETIWQDWQQAGHEGDIIPYIWPVPGLKRMAHNNLNAKVGSYAFSSDTAIMSGTWEAAYHGVQAALTAFKQVSQGGARAAFALTRPPGHHAHASTYGGYCFLNNAAIVAQACLDEGANKVCILDVDYHHGNGTQDIFYERKDVLTLSIHGEPESNFPYFLGYEDEKGEGEGLGFNANFPLADGTNFKGWSLAFEKARQIIADYEPDLLVVPLGVDTFEGDPISHFKLKSEDFKSMGAMIEGLKLPCVFVMEGGYDVSPIGQNVFNVLHGFDAAVP